MNTERYKAQSYPITPKGGQHVGCSCAVQVEDLYTGNTVIIWSERSRRAGVELAIEMLQVREK